jgi:hypothetical protein
MQAATPQSSDRFRIADTISPEFIDPKLPISARNRCSPTSSVMVPKATVDENRPFSSLIREIG